MTSLQASFAHAAPFQQPHAGEISLALDRLGTVGSVLYVAAHPDDENTRLLTWLVGARGLRAGYLSLTRGDGGQNLIGTEQDALLGLIRTHELLAARRIDGAEQLFTRARDFGYSKSAEETLRIWGKEEVLADVVLAIRRFRPDVIVTRFSPQPPNHGHHTASALLAAEAFTAAADPKRFPEQLERHGVQPWAATRLVHNVSTWNLKPDADMSAYLRLDVSGFEPRLGRSWGELAAHSRSQHKSQGFGVAAERGRMLEYFSHLLGKPAAREPFDGIELGWERFAGTGALVKTIEEARRGFDARAPHQSVAALLRVRAALDALPEDNGWKAIKRAEVERLLVAVSGLHVEARAAEPTGAPGEAVKVELIAIHRSPLRAKLVRARIGGVAGEGGALTPNATHRQTVEVKLPDSAPISTPYWLRAPSPGGLYTLAPEDVRLTGMADGPPALIASFEVELEGARLAVERPVVFAWTDPVRGELSRAFEVAPKVTAALEHDVIVFPNGAAQSVNVTVAAQGGASGKVRLELPQGWRAHPAEHAFALTERGDERTVAFRVTPPKSAAPRETVRVRVEVDGRSASWRAQPVAYEHIPPVTVRQASTGALVSFPLERKVRAVGYIPGPGDKVAESLAAVGYDVTVLPEARLAFEKLERFDAIVVGVRAFNANPKLAAHRERLFDYVARGGRLLVQYNTNSRVGPLSAELGPYPLELGRDRVTDETAAMTPLEPNAPLLRAPNRLTAADFEGWVQERGLYFASKWDGRYRAVFSMQDPGEAPLQGGLLVARHGKGTFIYTGLSFFRQLPAGVPGAYRLFANLLAS